MSVIINVLIGLVGLALILLVASGAFAIVVAVSWLVGKVLCKVFGDGIREQTDIMGRKCQTSYATVGFIYGFIACSSGILLYLLGSVIGRGIGL